MYALCLLSSVFTFIADSRVAATYWDILKINVGQDDTSRDLIHCMLIIGTFKALLVEFRAFLMTDTVTGISQVDRYNGTFVEKKF